MHKCDCCGKVTNCYALNVYEGYEWVCPTCSARLRKEKAEKEKQKKEFESLKKEFDKHNIDLKKQNQALKKEITKEKKSKNHSNSSSSSSESSGSSVFVSILKWIFSPIWGGPYILYNSIVDRNKKWIVIGVEYTLVTILSVILMSKFPPETSLYWINYIPASILIANVVGLIIYRGAYR